MPRSTRLLPMLLAAALLGLFGIVTGPTMAAVSSDVAQKLYEQTTPSLVVVKYTWANELDRRELSGAGVVVNEDGLIMSTISVFNPLIPDEQMKDFKILIPNQDKEPEEIEAVFQGRDERTSLAFLRPKEGGRKWKPLKFEEVPVKIGETVISIGMLPEVASYKTYLMESNISATLRGEVPQVLVQGGGLAALGSPVFNVKGKAIGLVGTQSGTNVWLNDTNNALAAINNPPKFYTPTRDFAQSLQDPPAAGAPMPLPWMGIPQMSGLNKDVAEVYNLTNQPAIQVGEVLPDTPAAKAGLKQGDIIVKVNGEPLERGDEASELPGILRRKILRMKKGEDVTLSILRKKGDPLQEIKVTLEQQPPQANTAKRFYADDLGFSVRDTVFVDRYSRHLAPDAKGVLVALVRPQSSAQSGGLTGNGSTRSDIVLQLNGQPVESVQQFETLYKAARKDKPREAVVLVVNRAGREDTVRIEPPQ